MISIITPFYQAEKYLETAIRSVLNQTHENWELLLINDGSTDLSKEIVQSFSDSRIRYFEQENKGVSAARNVGLKNLTGEYFCFLDADDFLTENSLQTRYMTFQSDPTITFVDGKVLKMDSKLKSVKKLWKPSIKGSPFYDLIKLAGASFFGPTWMIKSKQAKGIYFEEKLMHAEELYFYMLLSKCDGNYSYTEDTILLYRDSPNSAMKNLKGLENGYRFIESQIKNWPEVKRDDLHAFKWKYKKAMALAYLRKKDFINAFKVWS